MMSSLEVVAGGGESGLCHGEEKLKIEEKVK